MPTTPPIRIRSLTGYMPLVRELGGDPVPLLGRCRISPDRLLAEAKLPLSQVAKMLVHSEQTPSIAPSGAGTEPRPRNSAAR